jgi:hypothetical protein
MHLPWKSWLYRRAPNIVHPSTGAPASGAPSRKSFPIWVDAPPYHPLSGGIRAMNLLCHHLNRLGYDAFIIDRPRHDKAPMPQRYLTRAMMWRLRRDAREPIVVYPEITVGNPRQARFVVRYLLNKPGLLMPGAPASYGADDYYIDGAREHAPAGVHSFDLFMPLVDRGIYFPPPANSPRTGFALFTNRAAPDPATFPGWLRPTTLLKIRQPRSHAELGELYRHSRAMVIWERSSAIFEALSCGCPVICIGNESFNADTYHPRFRDCGLIWGWREQELDEAAGKTARFRAIYRELESNLDDRIRAAFDWILDDVRRRIGAKV